MMKQHLIVLGLFGFLLGACHKEEAHKEELPKLEVTTPMRKDTTLIKEYVCQIHAIRHIEMRAFERGYLQDIFVDEGKYVKAGQPMFKIMPNIYQAELMRAKAEANAIQIEYENTKALAEKNVVSQNELAIAKAKLDKALAEVNLHQTHLNFTDISAPFDGIMDHLFVRKGSLMQEGDLLTTLSDISKMWVYFNVPESEYLDFKARHEDEKQVKVHLRMANGEVFNQAGVIETIEADFDNKTGNIEFRAGFMNPERLLRHGETGNIMMDIPYKNAMLIPQKAIFEILDQQYVFVVGKDHKLEQRLVKVGADIQDMSIITDGLKDTDHVLIEGLRRVTKGDKIIEDFKTPDKVVPELKLYAE